MSFCTQIFSVIFETSTDFGRLPQSVNSTPIDPSTIKYTTFLIHAFYGQYDHYDNYSTVLKSTNSPSSIPSTCPLRIKHLDIRHSSQATTTTSLLILGLLKASSTLIANMLSEQREDLRVLPARRYRPVSCPESANGLRPFTALGTALLPSFGDGILLRSGG
jgi:hypothetical protein